MKWPKGGSATISSHHVRVHDVLEFLTQNGETELGDLSLSHHDTIDLSEIAHRIKNMEDFYEFL